jgi:C1A family cysteine protease
MTFNINGWKKQDEDSRDYSIVTPSVLKFFKSTPKLPKTCDLRKSMSPVVDQGELGSCTANAIAGIVDNCQYKVHKQFMIPSRLFTYYFTRLLEGSPVSQDTGATIRGTMKCLAKYGVPKEVSWSYDIKRFSIKPDSNVISQAEKYQALSYVLIDQPNMTPDSILVALKTQLKNKYPINFGFYVFDSYDQATESGAFPYPSKNENCIGGHAVVAVGYNDSKIIKNNTDNNKTTGAFLIRNSWGTSWGNNGYGWLPYGYVLNAFKGERLMTDCWVLVSEEWV